MMAGPRRVLVFAYYFPPLGLSGVQRIARFVKYLPESHWTPVVLTARPAGYFAFDHGLRDELDARGIEVHETRSADPTRVFGRRPVAFPAERGRRMFAGVSQWIFVPDNKAGWVRPAVARAFELHRETPFDAVVATAPPYSALVAAARFSARTGVPLVSDFRDDWLDNPRHTYPTRFHARWHRRLERNVVEHSAAIVTINDYIRASIAGRHPRPGEVIHVIPQGFDPEDFPTDDSSPRPAVAAEQCEFLYAGSFYDVQTPDYFLAALTNLIGRRPELRPRVRASFVGATNDVVRRSARKFGCDDLVELRDYVPHERLCKMLVAADVLWMTVGRQHRANQLSTGKLFEYFGTRKPVVGLVPDGAARDAIRSYSAGHVCPPDDVGAIEHTIERLVERQADDLLPRASDDDLRPYDRRALTRRLGSILDSVAGADYLQ